MTSRKIYDMESVTPSKKTKCVHVETELGIVNIYLGLRDDQGRRVEKVTILPDDYAGRPKIILDGTRMIEEKRLEVEA